MEVLPEPRPVEEPRRREGNGGVLPAGLLPFADDDPRTAEVVSKVLLLARDEAIRDPTILEQLVGRG